MAGLTDLADAHEEWLIALAKKGDRGDLVAHLRSNAPIGRNLRDFLADLLEGKVKLKPKQTLSWRQRERKWLAERLVYECAEQLKCAKGRQRQSGKVLSTLIEIAEQLGFSTNKELVRDYSKIPKSRRSPRAPRIFRDLLLDAYHDQRNIKKHLKTGRIKAPH